MNGWYFFSVTRLLHGNFEALKRDGSTASQRGGSKWCKHDLGSTSRP